MAEVEALTTGPGCVLTSYAHDGPGHQAQVLALYDFLRARGIDAVIDHEVADLPLYWPDWMSQQVREGARSDRRPAHRLAAVAEDVGLRDHTRRLGRC